MIEMRKHIRQSLSTRLCLNILFVGSGVLPVARIPLLAVA